MALTHASFGSSLRWLGAARLGGQLLSWVGTIWVMRLLVPGDYGLVAICTAVLAVATLVAELGFGAALVQAAAPTRDEIRSIFGASLLFAWFCAGALALGAPWLGTLFTAPEAVPMIRVAALTLVMSALATVPDAFLRREMAFRRISVIEFVSGVVATIVTVSMAVAGAGAWSLVVGPVVGTGVRVVLVLIVAQIWFLPSFRLGSARAMLGFGFKVALSRLASFVFGQADVLIGARVLSKPELGVYSIAMHLALLPLSKLMSVFNSVAFPAIAGMKRSAVDTKPLLLHGLRVVGHVVLPLLWGLCAVAPWLLPLLLGPSWTGAILPLQIVCLALPLRLVSVLLSTTLQGLGHAGLDLRNTITGVVLLPALFLAGSLRGAEGLALAWLVGLPLLLALNMYRSSAVLGFGIKSVLKALAPSAACSVAMAAVIGLLAAALGSVAQGVFGVIALCLTGAASYLALFWFWDRTSASTLLGLATGRNQTASSTATG